MKINHEHVKAVLIILMGAVMYSSKAIFIKLAYRYGADSISLVALRMAFSLPIFLLAAWWSGRDSDYSGLKFGLKWWPQLLILGLLGYYVASLCDFWALQYLSAGIARLILFTYPTLVVLISALFLKRPISWREGVALAVSYVGVAIALFAGSADFALEPGFWKGVILSFGSALAYALYLIGSGEYLPKMGTLAYTSVTMTIASVAILFHQLIQNGDAFFYFPPEVYYLCIGMAIFATVLPSYMVAEGIKRIGAGPSSIISSVGPISTIVLAAVFLGESFGGLQWLGAALVIGGVLLISLMQRK